jgi:hypothetical protein
MSLRRGDIYVWSDDERVHLWVKNGAEAAVLENPESYEFDGGIAMKQASFDEIVVMRLDRMTTKQAQAARKRATRRFLHHFNSAAVGGEGL